MQDPGFVFRGLVVAKAPFNRSNGSEDIHTYLPRLPFLSIGAQRGRPLDSRGLTPGGGKGHAHDVGGPLSCEPPASSPLMVQYTGHHNLP